MVASSFWDEHLVKSIQLAHIFFFFFEWIGLKAPEIFWNGNGLAMETYRVEELSCFWIWRTGDVNKIVPTVQNRVFNHPFNFQSSIWYPVSETEWVALFQSAEKGGGGHLVYYNPYITG